MGLSIKLNTTKESINWGYSCLHQIRFIAWKMCGGEGDFGDYMNENPKNRFSWEMIKTVIKFPNLIMHSDCEGKYTRRGRTPKPDDKNWEHGNLIGLWCEMIYIKEKGGKVLKEMKGTRTPELFKELYDYMEKHMSRAEKMTFY